MTTPVVTPPDTSEQTTVDVDVASEPACDRPPEHCLSGGQAPAAMVARTDYYSTCGHVYSLLVCQPCVDAILAVWRQRIPMWCNVCQDSHRCALSCHVSLVPL